jgi:hypothetical protein
MAKGMMSQLAQPKKGMKAMATITSATQPMKREIMLRIGRS